MSRPEIDPGVATAVNLDHLQLFPLIVMEFDPGDGGTVRITGTDFDVTYDGNVYTSLRGLGSMEAIVEDTDEVTGIRFTLSGVPLSAVTEALTVKYQGRPVTILWATLAAGVLAVDPLAWQGRLDVPNIAYGEKTCSISISAENRMADWQRPRQLMFNGADQRRIDATDTFLDDVESMEEREIVVFSKEVMRQSSGGG